MRNKKHLFQIGTILSRIELTAIDHIDDKECLGEQIYQRDYVICHTDTFSIFLRKNVEICEEHL